MRILVHIQSLCHNHWGTLLPSTAQILTPQTLWLQLHHTLCSSGSHHTSAHTISSPLNAPHSTHGSLLHEDIRTLPRPQGKVNPSILPVHLSQETSPPLCRFSAFQLLGNTVLALSISVCPGSSSVLGTWKLSANIE